MIRVKWIYYAGICFTAMGNMRRGYYSLLTWSKAYQEVMQYFAGEANFPVEVTCPEESEKCL